VVSFYAAHPPLTPPAFYFDRYLRAEIPEPIVGDWAQPPGPGWRRHGAGGMEVNLTGEALRACRAGYYGLINHVDDQLRRILNPLAGIQRMTGGNTVVIFTSDHGEMLGDHYLYHKRLPYEPSARIPMMFSAPERLGIDAGSVCDRAVCLEDIMPTVLEMAGVDCPQTVQGRSLLPLMRGESAEWREFLHVEHSPVHQSLTDGREKYIWFVQDGREQFFDLTRDPSECRDLAGSAEHADRLALWRRRLVEVLADRPEGFSDGERLIPGRPYPPVMERGAP
jgi:arylsulfatase A-like enzyme